VGRSKSIAAWIVLLPNKYEVCRFTVAVIQPVNRGFELPRVAVPANEDRRRSSSGAKSNRVEASLNAGRFFAASA
jgi:hypothetical protein